MRKRQRVFIKQLDELIQFSNLIVKTEVCILSIISILYVGTV